jgi:hypothetical protein
MRAPVFIAGLAAGGDMTSFVRCGIKQAGNGVKLALDTVADGLEIASNATDAAKEDVSQVTGIQTAINDAELDLFNVKGEIDEMLREEPILRAEVFARAEAIKQHVNDYKATLARGLRVMERLKTFRRNGAAEVQEYRYQDLAFRIFRNDALQKYRPPSTWLHAMSTWRRPPTTTRPTCSAPTASRARPS